MKNTILTYLTTTRPKVERSQRLADRFSRPAFSLLTRSNAYQDRDWAKLKELAQSLKAVNQSTIQLAQQYPDVFHANVVTSRRIENRIYATVIRLVDHQDASEAT